MPDEQDLMRKISGLLAKAEGTDNVHEADAFFSKAHELMVTYAIDEERVRSEKRRLGTLRADQPVVEDYMFSSYAHHAQAKQDLLGIVCKSRSVRTFPYPNRKDDNLHREGNRGLRESQWIKLVGYTEDIARVKMLYTSLLIQSQRFAAEDWRHLYGNDAKHSSEDLGKFTWVSGHMEGFGERISRRFDELTQSIYEQQHDANALITDKMANIMEWMYENGLARRPVAPTYSCWTPEPESNRPFNADGKTKSKKWEPAYCIKKLPAMGVPHEGEHTFTYHTPKMGSYSSYVAKGRRESYEGKSAGRAAAERADLGQPRTTSGSKLIRP